jgi:hypothetical protein
MEESKPSSFGPLRVFAIVAVGLIFMGYLGWNIPVGKTEAGNQVIVGDYVHALFPVDTSKAPVPQPSGIAVINASSFELLKPGVTTYALLRQYIGPGELQSSNSIGGDNEGRIWRNPDGSTVLLIFQNGVLVSKSQYGLQQ